MQTENNTIILVRALVKLSSAVYDIDELQESKAYKNQIKYDLNNFQNWITNYIKEPITSLTKADGDLLVELIDIFNDYDDTVFIKNEFTTKINLLLAKCYSALNDLKYLDKIHSKYIIELASKLNTLTEKKYFNHYIDYIDPNGKTFKDIIKMMDNEGSSIIVGTL
jgi:hypothetical protein